jgi:hypothetical protein
VRIVRRRLAWQSCPGTTSFAPSTCDYGQMATWAESFGTVEDVRMQDAGCVPRSTPCSMPSPYDDIVAQCEYPPPLVDRARQFAAIVDPYGVTVSLRRGFVPASSDSRSPTRLRTGDAAITSRVVTHPSASRPWPSEPG